MLEFVSLERRGAPLQLYGASRLEISIFHSYTFEPTAGERRSVTIRSRDYAYQILVRDGPELIAVHWHPGREDQPDFPHVQITGQAGMVSIQKRHHIPTGRVSLESVIRFAIEELGVRPLRPDWDRVLAAGQAAFDARRTW